MRGCYYLGAGEAREFALERLEQLDAIVQLNSVETHLSRQISAKLQLISSKSTLMRSNDEIRCLFASISSKMQKKRKLDALLQLNTSFELRKPPWSLMFDILRIPRPSSNRFRS
ncbi:hypothetical protein B9T62_08365 [Paenibacillus donghaensis]|uniref:Uncharacterized protein n=1 Tax=Paenibacillus donghaensis TaxID=414771 RepID=A0A2Z2K4K8_9BACL|nr:hypothetical protein B9T62_08365 [Paenibacillus donghaensis]